jgi:cytochrome c oxidase cbb3-type subunit 3
MEVGLRAGLGLKPLISMVLAVLILNCKAKSAQPLPAGNEPPSTFIIGSQPGPDRAFAFVSNPYENDLTVLAEGKRLFAWYNCAGCHGDHGGGGMGPSLRDSTWIYGGEARDIFASVAEGRANGMPAWGTKLPRDEMWQIVSYIRSMRTSFEPSPPQ